MARPATKEQLILASNDNFTKLFDLIASISIENQQKTFLFEDRDRNIRDVLIHLYEWHQLLLNWITSNSNGKNSNFLPDPYNWKTYPELNIKFWQQHQETTLDKAESILKESHKDVMKIIDQFSSDQLFIKKHFSWTGSTNLGSYCISATSSHYDWAIKKIKKQKKYLLEKT